MPEGPHISLRNWLSCVLCGKSAARVTICLFRIDPRRYSPMNFCHREVSMALQVKAGLKAIYCSGWQVAGDANTAGDVYPDQSLYPANAVPELVRKLNKA